MLKPVEDRLVYFETGSDARSEKVRFWPWYVVLGLLSVSCASQVGGILQSGGAANVQISASLEPRSAQLIKSLSGRLGGSAEEPSLDGGAIALSMQDAPGVKAVSFHNITPTTIQGSLSISAIDEFLNAAELPGQSRLIRYTPERRLSIYLDLASGPELVGALSRDIADYLSALMAPLATGERLGSGEYLELVTSVYGAGISREIAAARIQAVIETPGPIVRVQGGTFSGREARFDIPLMDILVLEKPFLCEIEWR
jgi:hypothetical protein